MYVCICRKVTDQQIQQAIDQGARHMRDLYEQFELGNQCGKCCECARSLLKTTHHPVKSSLSCLTTASA